MGSVSTHYGTELSLTLDELGVTGGYNTVVRKAAGGTEYGEKRTWFILESVKTGERFVVLALTSRGASYGVWCKVIDESMGPSETNVPDAIWNNLPPLKSTDGYAAEWRARVAAFKAEWPLALDKVAAGDTVEVTGHSGTWTRLAGSYKGSPLFTGTGYPRTRFTNWKSKRARLAVELVA